MAGNKNWTWQLRDRKGRWIDMGRGVKWYDSARKKEVSGTVVGSDKEGTAIVELTSEPAVNGKPQRTTINTNQVEAIKSKARLGVPATSPAVSNRPDLNEDGLTDAEDDEVERLSGLIDRAEKAGQYDKTVRQEEQREALLQKGRKRLDGEEVAEDNQQEPAQPKATTEPAQPEPAETAGEDEFPEVSREVRESLKPEYGAKVQHGGGPDFKGNYLSAEDAERFPVGTQIWDGDTDESGLKSDKTWTKTDENMWIDQRGDLFSDDEQTYNGDPYEVYLPGNPDNITRPSEVAKATTESEPEVTPETSEAPATPNISEESVKGAVLAQDMAERRDKSTTPEQFNKNTVVGVDGRGTNLQNAKGSDGKRVKQIVDPKGNIIAETPTNGKSEDQIIADLVESLGTSQKTAEAPQSAPETPKATSTPEPVVSSSEDPLEAAGVQRTEPYALPGEKFPPTRQQQDIIDSVLAGKNTSVQAKAGTGKTTTLEALAKRVAEQDPNKKIAYIAFNKTVQVEAEGRMPSNVEARTGHSIAHAWSEQWMKKRSNDTSSLRRADDVAGHLGIRQTVRDGDGEPLSAKEQALAAMRTVDKYSNSAEDTIDASHLPEKITGENAQKAVLDAANKIWEDLKNPDGKLKFSLDNMRKMWALSRPDLSKNGSGLKRGADIVFMDEAQDTPPVLARVMDEQKAQKVVVGDSDQNIYSSFTGSIDYMKQTQKDVELPLTKSWRFGPEVADVGNRFLQLAKSPGRVEGGGPTSAIGPIEDPDAILVRSNGGMIGEILAELEKGRSVGVPTGTKKDLLSLVNTASYLKTGNYPPSKMHDDLAAFKNWEEVIEEAEKGDNAKVSMIAKLVAQHGTGGLREIVNQVVETGGSGLPGVTYKDMDHGRIAEGNTYKNWGALRDAGFKLMPNPEGGVYSKGKNAGKQREAWTAVGTKEERDAMVAAANGESPVDVTISTAHKSKGLEWGKVKIGDDFRGPKVNEETGETIMPDDEEFRLAYVAVTRAEKELDPGSLSYVFDYTDENGGIPAANSPETEDQAQEREKPLPTEPDEDTDSGPATEEEAQEEAPPAEEEAPATPDDIPETPEDSAPEEAPEPIEEVPSGTPATDDTPEVEDIPEANGPTGVAPVDESADWADAGITVDNPEAQQRISDMADRIGEEEMGFTMDDDHVVIKDPEEALDTFTELVTEAENAGAANGEIDSLTRARNALAKEMERRSPFTPEATPVAEPEPEPAPEEDTPVAEPTPEPETDERRHFGLTFEEFQNLPVGTKLTGGGISDYIKDGDNSWKAVRKTNGEQVGTGTYEDSFVFNYESINQNQEPQLPSNEEDTAPEPTTEAEPIPEEPTATPEPAPAPEATPEVPEEAPESAPAPAPTPSATPTDPIVGKAANYPDGTQITDTKTGQVIEKTNGEWHEAGDTSKPVDPATLDNAVTSEMPKQEKSTFGPFGGADSLQRGDIILTTGGAQASVVGRRGDQIIVYPHNVPPEQKKLRPSIVGVTADKIAGVNKFDTLPEGTRDTSRRNPAPESTAPKPSSSSTGGSDSTPRKRAPRGASAGPQIIMDSQGNPVNVGDTVNTAKYGSGTVMAVVPSAGPNGSARVLLSDGKTVKLVRNNKMTNSSGESQAEVDDPATMQIGEGGMAADGRMFIVGKGNKPIFKGDRVTLSDGSVHIADGIYPSLQSVGFKDENGKPFRRKASVVEAEGDGPDDNGGDDGGNDPAPKTPTPDTTPEPETPTTFTVPEADRFPSEILDRANKAFEEMELDTFGALEQMPSKFADSIGRLLNNDMTLAEVHELVLDLANSARYKAMAAKTGGGDSGDFYATSRALRNLKYQLDSDFPLPPPDLGGEVPISNYDGSEGMRSFDFASSPFNPLSAAGKNFRMLDAGKAAAHHSAPPAITSDGVTLRTGMKVWDRESGKYLGIIAGIGRNANGFFASVRTVDPTKNNIGAAPVILTKMFNTVESKDQSWDTSEDLDFSSSTSSADIDSKLSEKYPGVEFNLKDGDTELSKSYGATLSKLFNKYPVLSSSMSFAGYAAFPMQRASTVAAMGTSIQNANHADSHLYVNLRQLPSLVEIARRNSNSGFYNNVPEGREMEYAITHEIGHGIDYRVGNLSTERAHAIISEVWGKGDASKMSDAEFARNIKGMVSNYSLKKDGTLHTVELMAESFADVEINGANAKPISKAIHYALMSELKKLQEG